MYKYCFKLVFCSLEFEVFVRCQLCGGCCLEFVKFYFAILSFAKKFLLLLFCSRWFFAAFFRDINCLVSALNRKNDFFLFVVEFFFCG